jgi:deazaflavin-dependent oxidoreductase (nitroreductase family)
MAETTRFEVLRPFTRRFVNPLTRRVADRLPGFAVLWYVGRKTGQLRSTPMNVFRRGETYVFALTYGPDVQWVKNVVAAGTCEIVTRGVRVTLVDPQLFVDPKASLMPLPVRLFLRLNRVTHFLRMRASRAPAGD